MLKGIAVSVSAARCEVGETSRQRILQGDKAFLEWLRLQFKQRFVQKE